MDFSADGRYAFASCEFAGRMIEVDLRTQQVVRTLVLARPREPAGREAVARRSHGLRRRPAERRRVGDRPAHVPRDRVPRTGAGAHGLYPSRNAPYVRLQPQAGSISVVSFRDAPGDPTWQLPLPASPDMGGVSADGSTLWLSGRYNAVVYAIDTHTGRLRAASPSATGRTACASGRSPGRYSLGHTGILR